MKKSRLLVAGSAISLALFSAVPSYAQDAQPDESSAEESSKNEEVITVTGSRIRLPNLESIEPTTTLDYRQLREFYEHSRCVERASRDSRKRHAAGRSRLWSRCKLRQQLWPRFKPHSHTYKWSSFCKFERSDDFCKRGRWNASRP